MSHTNIPRQEYYVYRHIRCDKEEPFYIGIGTKRKDINFTSFETEFERAFSKGYRNDFWKNITNKTDYTIEILLELDDYNFIKRKEREFIKLYGQRIKDTGTLCNLTDGGEGCKGYKVSDETRRKMSKAAKARNLSKERFREIQKMADNTSKQFRDKISKISTERWKDPEFRKKVKDSWKDYNTPEENRLKAVKARMRPVVQIDVKTFEIINSYESAVQASRNTGVGRSCICNVCKGKRDTAGGYIWKYKEEIN